MQSMQSSFQGPGGWAKVWSRDGGANRRSSTVNFLERTLELIEVYQKIAYVIYQEQVITSPKEQLITSDHKVRLQFSDNFLSQCVQQKLV